MNPPILRDVTLAEEHCSEALTDLRDVTLVEENCSEPLIDLWDIKFGR